MKIKTEYLIRGVGKNDKRAIIYTDIRQPDGSVRYEAVKGLIPYFYVPANARIPDGDTRILKVERGFTSIYGEDLIKIYTKLPYDVPGVRDNFYKHYEADVLFDWRFRINNGWVEKDNVNFFLDIEVAMGDRFVRDDYSFPITSMVCYDTDNKKYHCFTWRGDIKDSKELLKRKKRVLDRNKDGSIKKDQEFEDEYVLHKFSSEQSMLASFVVYFKHVNPDIVTAWNAGFDYPYIINRMLRINVDFSHMSPLGQVFIDKWSGDAKIKGRYVFDLLAAYRKLNVGQLDSFKLDDVGLFEFNVAKIKFDMTYKELWKKDLDKLIEYNIADVELCVELDKRKGVLDFYEGVSNFTGVPFDATLQNSRTLDFYFLRHAHKEGIVLPSVDRSAQATPFEGAIVMDPVKGLHENVMGLDLTALYPSIILSGNMSLETISDDGDIKFGNGISFDSKKEGFITKHVQAFLDRRKKIKSEMLEELEKNGKTQLYHKLNKEQTVTKFITNCFSPDTDVLTPEGIKNIKDFKVGDKVYSMNPETLETEVKDVVRVFEYDYSGDMVNIKSRFSDFVVTPNHNMFVSDGRNDNYDFYNAEELVDFNSVSFPNIKSVKGVVDDFIRLDKFDLSGYKIVVCPKIHGNKFISIMKKKYGISVVSRFSSSKCCWLFNKRRFYEFDYDDVSGIIDELIELGCDIGLREGRNRVIPFTYKISDFMKVVGLYISEGHLVCNLGERGVSFGFGISQLYSNSEYIFDVLDSFGIKYTYNVNRNGMCLFTIRSKFFYDFLIEHCGKYSKNKKIPEWVFSYDCSILNYLFESLMYGDGSKTGYKYTTVSKNLASMFSILCLHLGMYPIVAKYDSEYSGYYNVTIKLNKSKRYNIRSCSSDYSDKVFKSKYSGKVYCIEVKDNHTVYAGRNGKFQVAGQSIYGVLGFSSSRYFRQEIGETITYVGREINLHTQKVCEDNNATVLYGDTDSVYVKFDDDLSMDELISRMYKLQDVINISYDEFANRFNIRNHFFDIKAESIMERALFVKKKRYAGVVCYDEGVLLEGDKRYTKIMGFQNRRSDTSKFTKGFQKSIISMVLDGAGKKEVFKVIRDAVDEFEKLPVDDIAIPKNFTKPFDEYLGGSANSVFINAAKWCNRTFGMDIGGGSKMLFLYTRRPSVPGGVCYNRGEFNKLKSYDVVVDYKKMLERAIYMPLGTIIESLDWTIDELITGQEQMKLQDWF